MRVNVLDVGDDWIVRAVNVTPYDLTHLANRPRRWRSYGNSSEHVERDEVIEQLRRDVSAKEHDEIRELWKRHSDRRGQPRPAGLISTLTEDQVYEVRPDGARWEGHEGAARFYTEFPTAFLDIHFDLTDIVIGPQGVCEWARVTGTQSSKWSTTSPRTSRLRGTS